MKRELTVVSLLIWVLLAEHQITPTAVQAEGLSLTLQMNQATYQVGSQATVTLILRSTTAITGVWGGGSLGCGWNIHILDESGSEVFTGGPPEGTACLLLPIRRDIPPPIVKRATIPLHNNRRGGGDPLPPGLYKVQGILNWFRDPGCQGCGPQTAEVVIEITR
jgi:hypothetical protein